MTDILIIGGGPAGLTAAIYAARAGKTVVVFERESLGGQITQSHQVDNYPGLPGISGMELGDKLCAQAMDSGAEIRFGGVLSVEKRENHFLCETEDGDMEARAVIFAGGAKPRPLGLEREEELIGKGVCYCALCDGAFFRDQDVAVIGGGNTAFSDALFLAGICRSVTLVHRRNGFRAEMPLVRALEQTSNISVMTPYTVSGLKGDDMLEGLVLRHTETGESKELPVSGVFVAMGRVPDTALISHLADLDSQGFADANESCETATPGLFVAGDCRKKTVRQLTTAVSDGTAAATFACEYLDKL